MQNSGSQQIQKLLVEGKGSGSQTSLHRSNEKKKKLADQQKTSAQVGKANTNESHMQSLSSMMKEMSEESKKAEADRFDE